MFIVNFTPVAHEKYKVNAPCKGTFTEILNSDEERFGGQGRVNVGPLKAKKVKEPTVPNPDKQANPRGKMDFYELELYLPPLSVVVLKYDYVV